MQVANTCKWYINGVTIDIPEELHNLCRNHRQITASAVEEIYAVDDSAV